MLKKLLFVVSLSSVIYGQKFIADHTVATESVLRSIPASYIEKAKDDLHIVYQHTSHGTHVAYGLYGLQDYKSGDDTLFAVTNTGVPEKGKLDFMDCYTAPTSKRLSHYADNGVDASDLSRNETAFIQATRNFLEEPENLNVNVVMWSWCNIAGHNVSGNYLKGMDSLIAEYGVGGTRPRAATNPVTFIFMTGHANSGANVGAGKPKNQADLIIDHCLKNGYFCLDYYNIDTHDMDGNYWEDAGDNGQSSDYGGNFYEEWQSSHTSGEHWFENKDTPGGSVTFGAHNTQHITANRKAYAMWWLLARISGWSGGSSDEVPLNQSTSKTFGIYLSGQRIVFRDIVKNNESIKIVNIQGRVVLNINGAQIIDGYMNTSDLNISKGLYFARWKRRFDISTIRFSKMQ